MPSYPYIPIYPPKPLTEEEGIKIQAQRELGRFWFGWVDWLSWGGGAGGKEEGRLEKGGKASTVDVFSHQLKGFSPAFL